MIRRWGMLFVAAVIAGVGASVYARAPRPVAEAPVASAETAVAMRVVLRGEAMEVEPAAVEVGTLLALTIENLGAAPARVRLAGYEDRVDSGDLAPGARWTTTFRADRPGDDFAWLVGEEPLARLDVTGSHLVEGHR